MYTSNYAVRYRIPTLQMQIEVAGVTAAQDIINEAATTPDHANRLTWANWYMKNSQTGWTAFAWAVAMNPTIASAAASDSTGKTVNDSDVQFVVNSNIENVVTDHVAASTVTTPTPTV
jgi:hypothetical protein